MLRGTFLWLSEQPAGFDFLKRNGAGRGIASRFVAGETVEDAIAAALALNEQGITVSLDLLGESVSTEAETWRARDEVLRTLDAIAQAGARGNVSVKLTQLGLDIGYGVRRDIQESLRAQGFNMRVYVPFGAAWYPYLMRRLAERPDNLGFMVGSVARELFSRR